MFYGNLPGLSRAGERSLATSTRPNAMKRSVRRERVDKNRSRQEGGRGEKGEISPRWSAEAESRRGREFEKRKAREELGGGRKAKVEGNLEVEGNEKVEGIERKAAAQLKEHHNILTAPRMPRPIRHKWLALHTHSTSTLRAPPP